MPRRSPWVVRSHAPRTWDSEVRLLMLSPGLCVAHCPGQLDAEGRRGEGIRPCPDAA